MQCMRDDPERESTDALPLSCVGHLLGVAPHCLDHTCLERLYHRAPLTMLQEALDSIPMEATPGVPGSLYWIWPQAEHMSQGRPGDLASQKLPKSVRWGKPDADERRAEFSEAAFIRVGPEAEGDWKVSFRLAPGCLLCPSEAQGSCASVSLSAGCVPAGREGGRPVISSSTFPCFVFLCSH